MASVVSVRVEDYALLWELIVWLLIGGLLQIHVSETIEERRKGKPSLTQIGKLSRRMY